MYLPSEIPAYFINALLKNYINKVNAILLPYQAICNY